MIVRRLRKNERNKCAFLMGTAFRYSTEPNDSELDEDLIGCFKDDDETLMSQISVKNYKTCFCGKEIGCLGIAGVSTYPEYRRHGCIKTLFKEIFKEIEEKDWVVSLLYPFSYRYYRQYGYEVVFTRKSLTFEPSFLSHIERNSDAVLYHGEPEYKKALLSLYEEYYKNHFACLKREEDTKIYCENPEKTLNYTYLCFDGETPCGYFICRPDGDKLELTELVCNSPKALRIILGFLRNFDGQFRYIFLPYCENDNPVEYMLLPDYKLTLGAFYALQGRVLQVEKLLSINEYPKTSGSFKLKIFGDFIEKNNGVYTVSYGEKTDVKFEKDGDCDIALPIHSFSRLAFGGVPEKNIPYLDGAEIKNPDAVRSLAAAFPTRAINTFEHF